MEWTRTGRLDDAYAGEAETLRHPGGSIEWHTVWGDPGTAYRFNARSVAGAGFVVQASYAGTGVVTSRDLPVVRRADSEWLVGYVPLAGSVRVRWRQGDLSLRPGQFGVVPSTEPVQVRVSRRARTQTLFLPREIPDRFSPATEAPAARTLQANPAFHLLLQHLKLTMQLGHSLNADASVAATLAASELLAAALNSAHPESARSHDTVRIAQVKDWIDRSLGMPSLSVAEVAAANFVSPRTVQRLFSAAGETASAYIRRRRLEMCRADILAHPALPIAEICQRWGLPDSSHHARQFRAHFGASPQQIRAQAASGSLAGVTAGKPPGR